MGEKTSKLKKPLYLMNGKGRQKMRQKRRDHSVNMSRKQNFRNERVEWCREDEIIKAWKRLLSIVTEKSQEGFQGHG